MVKQDDPKSISFISHLEKLLITMFSGYVKGNQISIKMRGVRIGKEDKEGEIGKMDSEVIQSRE